MTIWDQKRLMEKKYNIFEEYQKILKGAGPTTDKEIEFLNDCWHVTHVYDKIPDDSYYIGLRLLDKINKLKSEIKELQAG